MEENHLWRHFGEEFFRIYDIIITNSLGGILHGSIHNLACFSKSDRHLCNILTHRRVDDLQQWHHLQTNLVAQGNGFKVSAIRDIFLTACIKI